MVMQHAGASHGIMIGHVVPEAAKGGAIALVQNGDTISIDLASRLLTVEITECVASSRHNDILMSFVVAQG